VQDFSQLRALVILAKKSSDRLSALASELDKNVEASTKLLDTSEERCAIYAQIAGEA
jgi:hypothetical protein